MLPRGPSTDLICSNLETEMQQQNMAAKNALFTFMLTSLTVLTRAHQPAGLHQHTDPEFSRCKDLLIAKQSLLLLYQRLNLKYYYKTHKKSHLPVTGRLIMSRLSCVTHTRPFIPPSILRSLSVHLCPPAARQLDPSGRGLVWGVYL